MIDQEAGTRASGPGRVGRNGSTRPTQRRMTLQAAAIGWVAAGFAPAASSHTAGVPIAPDSGYLIRWYQPHSVRPVETWEVEVTPHRNPAEQFITTAQVMPDDSCWAVNVPIAEPASVRMRSVSGSQVSEWTRRTSVPEPGLAAALAAATGLGGIFSSRQARRQGRGQA